jgi:hypothetical protein
MLWVNSLTKGADGWKAMELFFGFWLGVGLAFAIPPAAPKDQRPEPRGGAIFFLAALALAGLAVLSEELSVLRYSWAATGALMLLFVPYLPQCWRAAALALPVLPTLIDALEGKQNDQTLALLVMFIGVNFLLLAARVSTPAGAANLLALTGTSMALIKFVPAGGPAHHVAVAFVLMTAALLWQVRPPRSA